MKMMTSSMDWRSRFWFWVIRKCCLWAPWSQFSMVGNRLRRRGMFGWVEVTITNRDTTEPDSYSREELIRLLALIRTQEETQQWKVPEPAPCIYCHHVSPVDTDGFCPVCPAVVEGKGPCQCSTHQGGLNEAWRRAVSQRSRFTLSPAEASSEALNG